MNDSPTPRRSSRRADKVGQLVAREILSEITRRELKAGSRLPAEAQMMADYGVGRGTLREALRILEVNGLISIKPGPGGGPIVEESTTRDFARMATLFFHANGFTLGELVEARLIMEPVAARLAAQRRTKADIEKLKAIVEFEETGDEDAYIRASGTFHSLVAELSDNGVVSIFTTSLDAVLHARIRSILFPDGKARRDVVSTHAAIAQAIIDGNSDVAEKLMLEHMEAYARYLRKSHPRISSEVIDWIQ